LAIAMTWSTLYLGQPSVLNPSLNNAVSPLPLVRLFLC